MKFINKLYHFIVNKSQFSTHAVEDNNETDRDKNMPTFSPEMYDQSNYLSM